MQCRIMLAIMDCNEDMIFANLTFNEVALHVRGFIYICEPRPNLIMSPIMLQIVRMMTGAGAGCDNLTSSRACTSSIAMLCAQGYKSWMQRPCSICPRECPSRTRRPHTHTLPSAPKRSTSPLIQATTCALPSKDPPQASRVVQGCTARAKSSA
jgi:hypothetical protein